MVKIKNKDTIALYIKLQAYHIYMTIIILK
jgi:hypothetical protein